MPRGKLLVLRVWGGGGQHGNTRTLLSMMHIGHQVLAYKTGVHMQSHINHASCGPRIFHAYVLAQTRIITVTYHSSLSCPTNDDVLRYVLIVLILTPSQDRKCQLLP